jgi:hypothetical protein
MLRSIACETRHHGGSRRSLCSSMHPEGAAGHTKVDSMRLASGETMLALGSRPRAVTPNATLGVRAACAALAGRCDPRGIRRRPDHLFCSEVRALSHVSRRLT